MIILYLENISLPPYPRSRCDTILSALGLNICKRRKLVICNPFKANTFASLFSISGTLRDARYFPSRTDLS